MKINYLLLAALVSFSTEALAAKSCIPGPDNVGGCMGIPTLNAKDGETDTVPGEGRDSGGNGGRDSGGGGRDSGGSGGEQE